MDPENLEVDNEAIEDVASSAAFGTDQNSLESKQGDDVGDGANTDADSDIDFEALLLSPETPAKEEKAEEDPKNQSDKGQQAQQPKQQSVTDRLSAAREIAAKLDALPENQDANFKRLRELNRTLIKEQTDALEAAEKIATYGDTERIEKALKLADGLNGYDLTAGRPSTKGAAEVIHAESPEKAYNLALEILGNFAAKDGTPFAEAFTRNVLGIDPARLADFQALSRGEAPEGYEQLATAAKELEAVPTEYRDAYKRLTPKMREVVQEGLENFATAAEKSEALKILDNANKDVLADRQKVQNEADATEKFRQKIDATAVELENATAEAIGARISRGLDRLTFSGDQAVNATMRSAVATSLFQLVDERPFIRGEAERYFEGLGVDMKALRPSIDRHQQAISHQLDVEVVATARGQKSIAQEAARVRATHEQQLSAMALKLIAHVARKTKAGIAETKNLPAGHLPDTGKHSGSSSSNGGSLDWRAAAAATRSGRAVG